MFSFPKIQLKKTFPFSFNLYSHLEMFSESRWTFKLPHTLVSKPGYDSTRNFKAGLQMVGALLPVHDLIIPPISLEELCTSKGCTEDKRITTHPIYHSLDLSFDKLTTLAFRTGLSTPAQSTHLMIIQLLMTYMNMFA